MTSSRVHVDSPPSCRSTIPRWCLEVASKCQPSFGQPRASSKDIQPQPNSLDLRSMLAELDKIRAILSAVRFASSFSAHMARPRQQPLTTQVFHNRASTLRRLGRPRAGVAHGGVWARWTKVKLWPRCLHIANFDCPDDLKLSKSARIAPIWSRSPKCVQTSKYDQGAKIYSIKAIQI